MLKYQRYDGMQRTQEWFALRRGKVTASRLGDWLATSKRDGKPLKARLDYERELMFERQFNVSFSKFVTAAMADGIVYEDVVAEQYAEHFGVKLRDGGAFYNEFFCCSPDRLVGDDGGLEIKVLGDASFADVLANGIPENYLLQCQAGLYTSGRKWWDFVAFNLNTMKMLRIRVEPDKEIFAKIDEAVQEPITVKEFDRELIDVDPKAVPINTKGEFAW